MKSAVAVAVLLIAGATPAFAGDVPQATLAELGLGEIQVMTEVEGMEVRGMSSNAMSMGTSLVFGQLIDPATKSFVAGSDINTAGATAENGGKWSFSFANHAQESSLYLNLDVVTSTSLFQGALSAQAGGSGLASSH